MQYSQEHLKTMVYAKFGGQTECIMGNSKIENKICGCAAGLSLVDCTNKVWKNLSLIEFTGKTEVVDAYWQDLVLVKSTLILNLVQRKQQLKKIVPKCNLW